MRSGAIFWRLTAATKPIHTPAGLVDYCCNSNPAQVKFAVWSKTFYHRGLLGGVQVDVLGLAEAAPAKLPRRSLGVLYGVCRDGFLCVVFAYSTPPLNPGRLSSFSILALVCLTPRRTPSSAFPIFHPPFRQESSVVGTICS